MKNFFIAAFLLTISFGNYNFCFGQKNQKLPNIVFILADDLGYGDIKKCNPNAQIPTPHLNRLADEGILFTNAHSASSVCTPSRYGILTGRYAFRTSLKKGVLGGYSPALVEDRRYTIGDLAKDAGYTTAIIGKWHLGIDWKPKDASLPAIQHDANHEADLSNIDFSSPVITGPNNVGFDYSYILPASLDMSPYTYLENGISTDYPLVPFKGENLGRGIFWREGWGSKSFKIEQTLDNFTSKAVNYINTASKNNARPFFLYLTLTAPHTPWLPARQFKGVSNAGVYGDFVTHTDDAIGRILQCLDSLHLTENTLIIVTSDNGADWKKQDMAQFPKHKANYIFRGEKSDIWEGGHHIPLIISWKNGLTANRTCNEIFSLTDFMASFADFFHNPLPKGAGPDSYDFWPLISGSGNVSRPSIIHHSNDGMFAIRQGKWKFIDGNGSGGWSPKDQDDTAPAQLYDMEKDPAETTNLYYKYPEIVKNLAALLDKQRSQGYSVGCPF